LLPSIEKTVARRKESLEEQELLALLKKAKPGDLARIKTILSIEDEPSPDPATSTS
jgi:hypothetical protein